MLITSIFTNIWEWINNTLAGIGKGFNGYLDMLVTYIQGVPELFKWLGLLVLAIIIIFGVMSIIKKTFKLFIVIAVIIIIIAVIRG